MPTASIQPSHDIGIRSIDERSTTIVRWTDIADRGGRFAAVEGPAASVDDVRELLRAHR